MQVKLDSIDFNTVTFHPEFANQENYGYIYYVKENGKKMSYYFSIDSITRVTSQVPEPGTLVLFMLGLGGLGLSQLKRVK